MIFIKKFNQNVKQIDDIIIIAKENIIPWVCLSNILHK